MISPLLVPGLPAVASMVGTYAACDAVKYRLRRRRHYRLTRKHGRLLVRSLERSAR